MALEDKILVSLEKATEIVRQQRALGKRIALTSGCFDLVHSAHLEYLYMAAEHGDVLIVGVNSDESVRALKGDDRPIRDETDRAYVIAGFEPVNYSVVFADDVALILAVRADVYVASTTSNVLVHDDPDRLQALEAAGTSIVEIGQFSSLSSTALLQKANA